MSWFGKLAGATLGLLMGGPVGAALGAALGHQFDQTEIDFHSDSLGLDPDELSRVHKTFVTVLFQMMGHIAKSDGRVSESEIQGARRAMDRLDLTQSARLQAMRLFGEGKEASFALEEALRQFCEGCGGQTELVRFFITLQTEAALADGDLHPEKELILLQLCDSLKFSRYEYFGMRTRLQTERRFEGLGQSSGRKRGAYYRRYSEYQERSDREDKETATALHAPLGLQASYAVLGIAASATPTEIKRAYRRAISRHHPDKLTAAGVSPQQVQKATQMTQKIQKAYEAICRARSI